MEKKLLLIKKAKESDEKIVALIILSAYLFIYDRNNFFRLRDEIIWIIFC